MVRNVVRHHRYIAHYVVTSDHAYTLFFMKRGNFQAQYASSILVTRSSGTPANSGVHAESESERSALWSASRSEPTHSHPSVGMLTLAICTLALIAYGLVVKHADASPIHEPPIAKRGTVAYCRAHAANEYVARVCIVRVLWAPLGQSAKAVSVAHCESRINPRAKNGRYLGAWMMGPGPRRTYGHSTRIEGQTLSAIEYYLDERAAGRSGWDPWADCA